MVKKLSLTLASLVVSSVAFAEAAPAVTPNNGVWNGQKGQNQKAQKIESKKEAAKSDIDRRIEILKEEKSCIDSAQNRDDMRTCRDKAKRMRNQLKEDTKKARYEAKQARKQAAQDRKLQKQKAQNSQD